MSRLKVPSGESLAVVQMCLNMCKIMEWKGKSGKNNPPPILDQFSAAPSSTEAFPQNG